MNSLAGFQETYEDGSKAVYIKAQEYWKAIQVFVHEMVHNKYDFEGNVFYIRDSYGKYVYKALMEQVTDEIAKREYSKLTKDIMYQKAYSSEIIEKILEEDTEDILISLYKGKYELSNNSLLLVNNSLSELQDAQNIENARKAFKKLKKEVDRCPIKAPVFWRGGIK